MIVAVDESRAIGKNNQLLWFIPEDLHRFKTITTGHVVIMGENTFRSIGKPLPNRTNIVLTINRDFHPTGCLVVYSIEEALKVARLHEQEEMFVIGGASIYKQFLPMTERLYLTLVEGKHEADTFFPDYSEFDVVVSEESGASKGYRYTYFVRERSQPIS